MARRVLDSLTPEYSQIGAVWLPLPHLLNLLPVQIDAFYRTGASAVAISVLVVCARVLRRSRISCCESPARARQRRSASSMFATDPDVLYLQSTPMTEPLLFGLTLLAISFVYDWVEVETAQRARPPSRVAQPGTREGGMDSRCRVPDALRSMVRHRRGPGAGSDRACGAPGDRYRMRLKSTAQLAIYPVLAIVGFFFHSWFTIGEWFVTGGFFVPDNIAYATPLYGASWLSCMACVC